MCIRDRDYDACGNSFNFNSTLTWQRRFRKSGRSFILTTSGRSGNADRDGLLNAVNTYNLFNSYTDTVLQNQLYLDKNFQFDGRVAYTEPLGNKKFIEWNAYASNSRNKTNTDFYDIILPGVEERNILSVSYTHLDLMMIEITPWVSPRFSVADRDCTKSISFFKTIFTESCECRESLFPV